MFVTEVQRFEVFDRDPGVTRAGAQALLLEGALQAVRVEFEVLGAALQSSLEDAQALVTAGEGDEAQLKGARHNKAAVLRRGGRCLKMLEGTTLGW